MASYAPARSTKFCQYCGYVLPVDAATCVRCGEAQPGTALAGTSEKRIVPAALLCGVLGVFGAHRFYLGKTGTAVAQLLTLGGLGLWMLYDLIMLITGQAKDARGAKVSEW